MTNTHSIGPAMAAIHFHIATSQARRTRLNAKVPDRETEGAEQEEEGERREEFNFFSKEVRVGREMERGKKKGWMVTAG